MTQKLRTMIAKNTKFSIAFKISKAPSPWQGRALPGLWPRASCAQQRSLKYDESCETKTLPSLGKIIASKMGNVFVLSNFVWFDIPLALSRYE